MKELTRNQALVLKQIEWFISEHSYSPTHSELQKAMGFKSVNSIVEYLEAIERKGHIKRTPKISRSIVVLQA